MKTLIAAVSVCISVISFSAAAPRPAAGAWQLLMENKPYEARQAFQELTSHADPRVAAEAHRGLAEVAGYLGQYIEGSRHFFKSALAYDDPALFAAGAMGGILFSRDAAGAGIKEGYRVLKKYAGRPSLFASGAQDMLRQRYLNDGAVRKAVKILNGMGCNDRWMMIGPFDNISNSGYNTLYPPEKEIDFGREYDGKDGNRVRWNRVVNTGHTGWLFTEHHCDSPTATIYFYCAVNSPARQNATLAFGASGSFKIFLNGTLVMADSVFRNTGIDAFMQQVVLEKGDNRLLIKLCHEAGATVGDETRHANFMVRFLQPSFKPVAGLSYHLQKSAPQTGMPVPAMLRPAPVMDSIRTVLRGRLAADSTDLDAALLLMHYYNVAEMTDDGQVLARAWLKRYPQSALWYKLYAESLLRGKKSTEAEIATKKAYRFSPYLYDAWANELATLRRTADARNIIDFLQKSPEDFQRTVLGLISRIRADFSQDKKADGMSHITQLEKEHPQDYHAIMFLAAIYFQQGMIDRAEKLILGYLKTERTKAELYKVLAEVAVKQGNMKKAVKAIADGLRYQPVTPDFYEYMAELAFMQKDFKAARKYTDRLLTIMPFSDAGLNLLGNIHAALGQKEQARAAFMDAVRFTRNDFNAWEQIRALDEKPSLDDLAPLPSVDSLLAASSGWKERTYESGSFLVYIRDVFLYPSHCSREREFMAVHLPTQKAIDLWKERRIGYNGNFQYLNIAQALSYKADGTQVPADISGNQVVFKNLEPGDNILLEWTKENYYIGRMANHVWGQHVFHSPVPVFLDRLRLVTPVDDTLAYRVYGDSLTRRSRVFDDYRVTSVARGPYRMPQRESYMMTDWPELSKVNYGTFASWSQIADWYYDLTDHIPDNSLELSALADSLFTGAAAPTEKVRRMHDYIVGNIRYSYQSFRQSGWIPQKPGDVLATRMGDCKDMSLLGKCLLEKAGFDADLVLVNTEELHFTDHAYIGPNFNHCILGYTAPDSTQRYIDLTDNHLAPTSLPRSDQHAMALVVRPGNGSLITLPGDAPEARLRSRVLQARLQEDGTYINRVTTLRTGINAGSFRNTYRFLSDEERRVKLHDILASTFPSVTLDTFTIEGIDRVGDSLRYTYRYTARNTVTRAGKTSIFAFHLPDLLEADDCPSEEERKYPLDLNGSWFGIGTHTTSGSLTFPETWKPVDMPEDVRLESPYGSYELSFTRKGNVLSVRRRSVMNIDHAVPVGKYSELKDFLNKIVRADDIKLVFFTEQ